ncbi:hypothetical protein LOAG_17926 [Loa loa]|uniref:Uncharacterized protein n=1 Tax=Loa loa TaxID=7209 RepID=A0A1S0UHB2_LOALO|nr:hypothetical protein LOAG_17926 [Loa loa]EJD74816.1 hypothetical protein LOAG_17926 [Loa loa]
MAIKNMEINESTDEYGRNIARIQIPRSILYENAIEIKKFNEKDDNNNNNNDNDDDDDDEDEAHDKCITIK